MSQTFQHHLFMLSLHRPLGEREAVFMHTPALDALPSRTYIEGKLTKVNNVVQPSSAWRLKKPW